jgi:hypothetical protein
MSVAPAHDRLQLPESLQAQLHGFRRRVWGVKTTEAASFAAFGLLVAFLLMFAVDRVWDTPAWARAVLFAGAAVGCASAPVALHRWVWQCRRPDQLARLIALSQPHFGDELLGVIELVHSDMEIDRSPALCAAAVAQVAEQAAARDFSDAVPTPRHRLWAGLVAPPLLAALALALIYPAAAGNAWARVLAPWKGVPRYTFAAVAPLPATLVVPHGEPFTVVADIAPNSLWKPAQGVLRLNDRDTITASLKDGAYTFEIPAQIDPGSLSLRIGDARQRIVVAPTLRPELTAVVADVTLPKYLGRPKKEHKDARGGTITVVKGSEARFAATASRALAAAQVDGQARTPKGPIIDSPASKVDGPRTVEFSWRDVFGLSGKEPFRLNVNGREDEAPTLFCEDLPRQKVVLDTEQLAFKVRAQDDFGVKTVGIEWRGADDAVVKNPAKGDRVLGAGAVDRELLDLAGSFSAQSLGIEPQPIALRVYAEDYLPGRPRVYSPVYTLYVLNAEQHAIWLTEQLSKWHKQSLEVRDRELQLHATNKQLRELSPEDLDRPENRRRIEHQADAERANGRRLNGLVTGGEDLVRQAMRNPEFGVGHLEKWAQMLQILKDIAGNRMPSVADLLKQAAQAPTLAMNPPSNTGPVAGNVRSGGGAKPGGPTEPSKKPPVKVPGIVDQESTQQPPSDKPSKNQDDSPSKPKTPRLLLPQTTLAGTAKDAPKPPDTPAQQTVDNALKVQQDLLAEFDKIAEELNKVLANLEGSTLVKRLKAAARLQDKVAGRIGDHVSDAFGVETPKLPGAPAKVLGELAEQEGKQSQLVSFIMDDLQSYFERRQYVRFKTVLDDMKKEDVIGGLRQVGDDLRKENGVSMAQCEFWSDSLDRWAEDLVDPTKSGKCPGSKSKASLPPSLILEVLRILEGEINLREETRVSEQARPALAIADHGKQANGLSKTQTGLDRRVKDVINKIRELPDAEAEFAYEIGLLGEVSEVMEDAAGILKRPDTGKIAIAAETDAIELLLKSKRINPKGGGGGGPNPGGGGTGTTNDSALALVGGGLNAKENREDHGVSQSTGDAGPSLPEEFRAGLDEYFNRLERKPNGQ